MREDAAARRRQRHDSARDRADVRRRGRPRRRGRRRRAGDRAHLESSRPTSCSPTSACRARTATSVAQSHEAIAAPARHIPVLLLTGAFEPVDQARARRAAATACWPSRSSRSMVVGRVKELLAERRTKRPANGRRTSDRTRPRNGHGSRLGPGRRCHESDAADRIRCRATLRSVAAAPTPVVRLDAAADASPIGGFAYAHRHAVERRRRRSPRPTTAPVSNGAGRRRTALELPAAPIREFGLGPRPAGGSRRRAAPPPPAPARVSLADAFAALLAAEQSRRRAPAASVGAAGRVP